MGNEPPELDLGDGSDELNLAEFPLSLVSNRVSDGAAVLVFEDTCWDAKNRQMVPRKVTISGSADCGLPVASDEEVLLALIQITNQQGFKNKRVNFSRYQLLQILGWEDTGYYYKRIESALDTWLGVNVKWKNAWRDYALKSDWGNKGIVLIQDFEIARKDSDRNGKSSHITWADQLFESFRSGNLKGLDFNLYRALRNNIAKRMFRFLDKRFYVKKVLTFNLATFAYEKVGMKRSYALANVKQQFKAAIDELVSVGFLKPLLPQQRYRKLGAGSWEITFIRGMEENGQRPLQLEVDVSGVEKELVKRGVTRGRATNLAAKYPEDVIREKIEEFDFRVAKDGTKRGGGYLADSIEGGYGTPTGFKSKATLERERLEKESLAVQKKKKELEELRKAQEAELAAEEEGKRKREEVAAHLSGLEPEARKAVEEEALRCSLFGENATEMMKETLIFNHVTELLEKRKAG